MVSPIVLTYKTATLRQKDVETLEEGQWLKDPVLTFYMEYL